MAWISSSIVTDGIESALKQAKVAAGNKDIMLAGAARAIQQYLKAGLLGEDIRLFENIGAEHIELEKISVIALLVSPIFGSAS